MTYSRFTSTTRLTKGKSSFLFNFHPAQLACTTETTHSLDALPGILTSTATLQELLQALK